MRANSDASAQAHPDTVPRHFGGGLCTACWFRQRRRRDGPVRPYHRHDDVLDDYEHLTTGTAVTRRGVAAQLGITPEALNAHLRRARKRGDPRARKVIPP